jgi:hypothetical protein
LQNINESKFKFSQLDQSPEQTIGNINTYAIIKQTNPFCRKAFRENSNSKESRTYVACAKLSNLTSFASAIQKRFFLNLNIVSHKPFIAFSNNVIEKKYFCFHLEIATSSLTDHKLQIKIFLQMSNNYLAYISSFYHLMTYATSLTTISSASSQRQTRAENYAYTSKLKLPQYHDGETQQPLALRKMH